MTVSGSTAPSWYDALIAAAPLHSSKSFTWRSGRLGVAGRGVAARLATAATWGATSETSTGWWGGSMDADAVTTAVAAAGTAATGEGGAADVGTGISGGA